MKSIAALSATALLATPFYMVAQADEIDTLVQTGLKLYTQVADAFEGITIENMDVLYERLWELQPQFSEYSRALNSLSKKDEERLMNHPTFIKDSQAQFARSGPVMQKIDAALRHATEEQIDIFKDVRELYQGLLRGREVARSPRIPKKGVSATSTATPAANEPADLPTDKVAFYKQEGVAVYADLADMFEKATPATLDQLHKQIIALHPRFQKLRQIEATMSHQDQREVSTDREVAQNTMNAMMRLMSASEKLQNEVDSSSAEQKAKMQLITEEIQKLMRKS